MESNRKLWARLHCILRNEVATLVCYILLYLVLPLLVLTIFLFMLMREVIRIVLKLKYGNLFGGFLKSPDAVWAPEDVSKTVINVIITINVKSNKPQHLIEQIKATVSEKVFRHPDLFPKLTSIRLRLMGFNFLLKDQITVEDCVFPLKFRKKLDTLNDVLLQQVVSEYSNQPLPKKNSVLWEILVSPIPMQEIAQEEQPTVFPVLFRCSHIVGDGQSLQNLLKIFRADDSDLSTDETKNIYPSVSVNEPIIGHNILLKLLKSTRTILTSPAVIMYQTFLRKEDNNALHGPKLSGNKILVYAVEKKRKLVPLVKSIKWSVPDSKFSDVLLTAISGSFNKYFTNNSSFVPHFVTAAVTALLSPPNMSQNSMLQNQFSIAYLDLPIFIESTSMIQRLQEVMKQRIKLRNSPDYQVNYWFLKLFCGVIPHTVLQHSTKTDKTTTTVSNVPGLPKLSILDGSEIEDVIFYTPHRGKTGVGITIMSYDDRFQLGLAVDKSIISSVEKVQSIINDIFEQINVLCGEVFSSNTLTK